MTRPIHPYEVALVLALALSPPVAQAAPRTLTLAEALEGATQHSPTLQIAVIELRQARLSVTGESARYASTFNATTGYTSRSSPSLRVTGVDIGRTESLVLNAGVQVPFSFGTTFDLQVELGGSGQRDVDPDEAALQLGPGYEVLVQLSAAQPLLRGLGDAVGEASLRQARASLDAATHARHRTASELLRDVIGAYWELWYAQAAQDIQLEAVEVAGQQVVAAQARAQAGRIPDLSVLPFRMAVATAQERLIAAETATRIRRLGLARYVGFEVDEATLDPTVGPTDGVAQRTPTTVVAQARANAYSLRESKAAVARAQVEVVVADDATDARLDAVAWLSAAGLGNNDVPSALQMFGQLEAVSAFVGLELELPIDNTAARAQLDRANASVALAEQRLRDAEQILEQSVLQQLATVQEARARLGLVRSTAQLAGDVAAGQKRRFEVGNGTALEMVVAEQDRSAAQLRAARAQADVVIATASLDHLTGQLLSRVAVSP